MGYWRYWLHYLHRQPKILSLIRLVGKIWIIFVSLARGCLVEYTPPTNRNYYNKPLLKTDHWPLNPIELTEYRTLDYLPLPVHNAL